MRALGRLQQLGRSPARVFTVPCQVAPSPPARLALGRFKLRASKRQTDQQTTTTLERPKLERSSGLKASSGESFISSQAASREEEDKAAVDWTEVYKLGKIALPVLLQYMIGSSSHLINTSFVGHLSDPVLLSSMVLATSLSMATGYTVMNGVASASETLCGQAHGAKNFRALQDTLVRALLITGLTCVPISLAWSHSEAILVALGQPEAIAHGAARYLQLTLPALYLYSVHECVDKYLLSQRVVKPSLFITGATTALTPLFAWWFVVQQNLGLEGAAYAYVAVQACTTTLGLAYLGYRELIKLPRNPPVGWEPLRPTAGALMNWAPYLALAVPAVLSYCMEGWATEVLIFLSGMLENADVAVGVTGLALQFSTVVWLAAASIGSATSTRVANKLGRGDAAGAQATAQTAVRCVLLSQTLIGTSAYVWRQPLMELMTNNPEVIKLSMEVMPVLACCFIADGLNAVQGAVLRGAGRQWWTAGLNIAGWWGVGVPLAYYLAIVKGYNVPGLWAGFATASALQSGLQYLAVTRGVDWDVEVQRAKLMMTGPPVESSMDEGDEGEDGQQGMGTTTAGTAGAGRSSCDGGPAGGQQGRGTTTTAAAGAAGAPGRRGSGDGGVAEGQQGAGAAAGPLAAMAGTAATEQQGLSAGAGGQQGSGAAAAAAAAGQQGLGAAAGPLLGLPATIQGAGSGAGVVGGKVPKGNVVRIRLGQGAGKAGAEAGGAAAGLQAAVLWRLQGAWRGAVAPWNALMARRANGAKQGQ